MTTRQLRAGEPLPEGEPSRYLNDRGYVRLRWLVGVGEYVEVYEHRLVMGIPPREMEIHHINGIKTDNRRANLVALSKSDHAILHSITDTRDFNHPKRQPLNEYPRCSIAQCERPAQCVGRSLCLMHYKRLVKHGSTDPVGRSRK